MNSRADKPKLPKEQFDRLMAAHMANMDSLAKEGRLLIAGPFQGGGGIFVFATNSLDSAASWLKSDPAIRANRWNVEIHPFVPRRGSICPVGEKFGVTSTTVVRFGRFSAHSGRLDSVMLGGKTSSVSDAPGVL
ncbi:MAG TPA: YciI family protein [Bacteroidota bacterium]|nr:YciI family protein [Bacteroidota bacterium]